MDDYSFEFIAVVLFVGFEIVINTVSGVGEYVEHIWELTVCVEFELFHSFVVKFKSFEGDDEYFR